MVPWDLSYDVVVLGTVVDSLLCRGNCSSIVRGQYRDRGKTICLWLCNVDSTEDSTTESLVHEQDVVVGRGILSIFHFLNMNVNMERDILKKTDTTIFFFAQAYHGLQIHVCPSNTITTLGAAAARKKTNGFEPMDVRLIQRTKCALLHDERDQIGLRIDFSMM